MSPDTLVIGMVDDCPVYRCEHDGRTHEHPRRHVVDADHRLALRDATARLTVTLDVARAAYAAWDEHARRCDQCNYDKACFLCEIGGGEAETGRTTAELADQHACNCSRGNGGAGYHLRVAMTAGTELYGWEAVSS